MYKDILTQIAKYLKPQKIYYPHLDFILFGNGEIDYYLSLINSIEGEISTKFLLFNFCNYSYFIDKIEKDNNLYFLLIQKEASSALFYPKIIFIIDKNMSLKIFNHKLLCRYDSNIMPYFYSRDDLRKHILEVPRLCENKTIPYPFLSSIIYQLDKKKYRINWGRICNY